MSRLHVPRLQAQFDGTARAELAARLRDLIDLTIDPQAIALDEEAHAAFVIVDRVLFCLRS